MNNSKILKLTDICKRSKLKKISGILLVETFDNKIAYAISKEGFSKSKDVILVDLFGNILNNQNFYIIGPMQVPEF